MNPGVAATTGEFVLFSNPDAVPEPGAVAALVRFASAHPRRRDRRPATALAGRDLAAVAAPLPDRERHDLAPDAAPRSCASYDPERRTTASTSADRAGARRLDARAPSCCSAGRCWRRSAAGTRASATTSRTSTSPTARCGRAGSAGSCPEAVVDHAYAAVIDKRFLSRHTLWHLRGMARFVRKHPERCARSESAQPVSGNEARTRRRPPSCRPSDFVGIELAPARTCRAIDLDPPRAPGARERRRRASRRQARRRSPLRSPGRSPAACRGRRRSSRRGRAPTPGSSTPFGQNVSRERDTRAQAGPVARARRSGCTPPPSPSSRRRTPRRRSRGAGTRRRSHEVGTVRSRRGRPPAPASSTPLTVRTYVGPRRRP